MLRPVEETSDEWAGVSGQISTSKEEVKREVGRVEQKADAMAAAMEDKVGALEERLKANQAEMSEQRLLMAKQQLATQEEMRAAAATICSICCSLKSSTETTSSTAGQARALLRSATVCGTVSMKFRSWGESQSRYRRR